MGFLGRSLGRTDCSSSERCKFSFMTILPHSFPATTLASDPFANDVQAALEDGMAKRRKRETGKEGI